MSVCRISHVALKVRELDAADHFYRSILGMEKIGERPRMWFYRASSGQQHDLALFELGAAGKPSSPEHVGMFHLCFAVTDEAALADLYRRCKEAGVPMLGEIGDERVSAFYVQDPDGNTIELGVNTLQEEWAESAAPFNKIRAP